MAETPAAQAGPGESPEEAPGPPQARPRLRVLDGLRLVAALAVLAYHFTARDHDSWGAPPWTVWPGVSDVSQYGYLGVNLFFVISGFVILMTAWGRSTQDFVVSRVARLFPAYWASVALSGFLLIVLWPGVRGIKPWEAVANLTMAPIAIGVKQVDLVYWTLWSELRFYLLIGALTLIGITRRRILAMALFWPLLAVVAHESGADFVANLLVWEYAAYFAIGMVLYLIHRDGASLMLWLVVAFDAALVVGVTGEQFPSGYVKEVGHDPSLYVTLAVIALCIAAVAVCTSPLVEGIQWAWLTTAGALTYPLYLLHEYWGWYFIDLLAGRAPKYVVAVAAALLCLGLAWLVYRFVEVPLGPRLRRAVKAGLEQAAARDGHDRTHRY